MIINSGTFRSDQIHPKGEFKVRDLKAILPFLDTIIVLALTGLYKFIDFKNNRYYLD